MQLRNKFLSPKCAYLAAMGGIVKMLGDWGNLVILTEPGELLEPETFSRTEFSGNDEL